MKRSSPRAAWSATAAALALAVGLAVFYSRPGRGTEGRPQAEAPAPGVPPRASGPQLPDAAAPAPKPADTAGTPTGPAVPLANEAAPPAETASGREQTLEAIQELVVTYDAASVPALARFLSSQDAEIRNAAREGLIQLGERAAIPYLEEAARRAAPEEAQALREAAEFLALPTWTERREALKARKKTTP